LGFLNSTISCIPNKGIFNNFTFEFELNDTRVSVYNVNKELIKVFTTKEVSECYNIARNPLNGYIRSGKLHKKHETYFYNFTKNNPYYTFKDDNKKKISLIILSNKDN
jgi:hypothetical protein